MIVEERDQIRLFARHEPANEKRQGTAEREENYNENIGQRRGKIADCLPLHDNPDVTHRVSPDAQHGR